MDPTHQIETTIIEALEFSDDPVPTLDVSKHVFGKEATKKKVNPYLYGLMKKGVVDKICEEDGTKPKWRLK